MAEMDRIGLAQTIAEEYPVGHREVLALLGVVGDDESVVRGALSECCAYLGSEGGRLAYEMLRLGWRPNAARKGRA